MTSPVSGPAVTSPASLSADLTAQELVRIVQLHPEHQVRAAWHRQADNAVLTWLRDHGSDQAARVARVRLAARTVTLEPAEEASASQPPKTDESAPPVDDAAPAPKEPGSADKVPKPEPAEAAKPAAEAEKGNQAEAAIKTEPTAKPEAAKPVEPKPPVAPAKTAKPAEPEKPAAPLFAALKAEAKAPAAPAGEAAPTPKEAKLTGDTPASEPAEAAKPAAEAEKGNRAEVATKTEPTAKPEAAKPVKPVEPKPAAAAAAESVSGESAEGAAPPPERPKRPPIKAPGAGRTKTESSQPSPAQTVEADKDQPKTDPAAADEKESAEGGVPLTRREAAASRRTDDASRSSLRGRLPLPRRRPSVQTPSKPLEIPRAVVPATPAAGSGQAATEAAKSPEPQSEGWLTPADMAAAAHNPSTFTVPEVASTGAGGTTETEAAPPKATPKDGGQVTKPTPPAETKAAPQAPTPKDGTPAAKAATSGEAKPTAELPTPKDGVPVSKQSVSAEAATKQAASAKDLGAKDKSDQPPTFAPLARKPQPPVAKSATPSGGSKPKPIPWPAAETDRPASAVSRGTGAVGDGAASATTKKAGKPEGAPAPLGPVLATLLVIAILLLVTCVVVGALIVSGVIVADSAMVPLAPLLGQVLL